MSLLAAPLVNEGTLHYAPPDRMARHTLQPAVQSVVLDGQTLRMGDAERSETLDLGALPVVREFVDSFLLVLRGDRPALERAYAVDLRGREGVDDGWTIALTPRRSPMKEAIARIVFVGRGVVVETLTIEEVGGDRSVTTFSDADPARRYTPEEAARVFRLQPPR